MRRRRMLAGGHDGEDSAGALEIGPPHRAPINHICSGPSRGRRRTRRRRGSSIRKGIATIPRSAATESRRRCSLIYTRGRALQQYRCSGSTSYPHCIARPYIRPIGRTDPCSSPLAAEALRRRRCCRDGRLIRSHGAPPEHQQRPIEEPNCIERSVSTCGASSFCAATSSRACGLCRAKEAVHLLRPVSLRCRRSARSWHVSPFVNSG